MKERVLDRFRSHSMNGEQITASNGIRRTVIFLAEQILTDTPPGREQELALQRLEESLMYANKAIALHPPDGPQNLMETPAARARRLSTESPG